MTALVQIVEIADDAAIGGFPFDFAGGQIDVDPGVTARPRQRDVDLFGRPFDGVAGDEWS
eukprot:gene4808-6549_t